jgi:hypothetical protein
VSHAVQMNLLISTRGLHASLRNITVLQLASAVSGAFSDCIQQASCVLAAAQTIELELEEQVVVYQQSSVLSTIPDGHSPTDVAAAIQIDVCAGRVGCTVVWTQFSTLPTTGRRRLAAVMGKFNISQQLEANEDGLIADLLLSPEVNHTHVSILLGVTDAELQMGAVSIDGVGATVTVVQEGVARDEALLNGTELTSTVASALLMQGEEVNLAGPSRIITPPAPPPLLPPVPPVPPVPQNPPVILLPSSPSPPSQATLLPPLAPQPWNAPTPSTPPSPLLPSLLAEPPPHQNPADSAPPSSAPLPAPPSDGSKDKVEASDLSNVSLPAAAGFAVLIILLAIGVTIAFRKKAERARVSVNKDMPRHSRDSTGSQELVYPAVRMGSAMGSPKELRGFDSGRVARPSVDNSVPLCVTELSQTAYGPPPTLKAAGHSSSSRRLKRRGFDSVEVAPERYEDSLEQQEDSPVQPPPPNEPPPLLKSWRRSTATAGSRNKSSGSMRWTNREDSSAQEVSSCICSTEEEHKDTTFSDSSKMRI